MPRPAGAQEKPGPGRTNAWSAKQMIGILKESSVHNRDLGDLVRIAKGGTMKGPQLTRASLHQVSSSVLYGLHYILVRGHLSLIKIS